MNVNLCLSVGRQAVDNKKANGAKIKQVITVFNECDEGNKGFLSREDVKIAVVTMFGYKPSKYEVDQMMQGVTDRKGLTQEQFVTAMSSKMVAQDRDDEIRQIFMTFDTHCRGFLTLDDLCRAFKEVAPHTPRYRIETVFREIDRDGDGRVSYRDFEFMMKYSLEEGF